MLNRIKIKGWNQNGLFAKYRKWYLLISGLFQNGLGGDFIYSHVGGKCHVVQSLTCPWSSKHVTDPVLFLSFWEDCHPHAPRLPYLYYYTPPLSSIKCCIYINSNPSASFLIQVSKLLIRISFCHFQFLINLYFYHKRKN